jgi:hypothetical protein
MYAYRNPLGGILVDPKLLVEFGPKPKKSNFKKFGPPP